MRQDHIAPKAPRLTATQVLVAVALVLSATNAITAYSAPQRTVSVPSGVGFEGYLLDPTDGQPLDGEHDLTFRLYDVATGGSPLSGWSTNVYSDVPVEDGFYSVLLTGLPVANFTGDRWLGVTVDAGSEITPRTRIASVPFALNAQSAISAEQVPWSGISGMPSAFSDGIDHINGSGAPTSNGAIGRVPVFDTAESLAGSAGLLYANNILTVTGLVQQSSHIEVRAYHNAHQSVPHNTNYIIQFNSERFDSGDAHYTSSANLTGTVAKTNGSATLTGTGTSFTTELSVGQLISVPGGSTELRVVTAIASNTSLTVSSAFANTSSGQTAARKNTALVARVPGTYLIVAQWEWAPNGAGHRFGGIRLNGSTNLAGSSMPPDGTEVDRVIVTTIYQLAQWDFVDILLYQNSGSTINIQATPNQATEFMMVRLP